MSGVALPRVLTAFSANEHPLRPRSTGPGLGPGSSRHQLWDLSQVMLISFKSLFSEVRK